MVASEQLSLALETDNERSETLEDDAATKLLRLTMETDEEIKARLEKMVATAQLMLDLIKGVVDVGVVLSLKPVLKSLQLLSFKHDVVTTSAPTTETNIDMNYCLLLSFFFICT